MRRVCAALCIASVVILRSSVTYAGFDDGVPPEFTASSRPLTPSGLYVDVLVHPTWNYTSAHQQAIKASLLAPTSPYPNITIKGDATWSYNCHSYAWQAGVASEVWLNGTSLPIFIADPEVAELEDAETGAVFYYGASFTYDGPLDDAWIYPNFAKTS